MNTSARTTSSFYDGVWQNWSSVETASPAAFHRRRLVVDLLGRHAPRARRVLDAGCGPGVLLAKLARERPELELHGADVSPEALTRAGRVCSRADLFLLDLEAPDFERRHAARLGRYDVVIASEVIEHLGDDQRALSRLRALIVPGGTLIVSVPGGARTRFDLAIGHVRHYSSESLAGVLVAADLRIERVMAWGFPVHTLYRALVRLASRASVRSGGAPGAPAKPLLLAYRAVGAVLTPLYFLNLPCWGTQLFAVARRSAPA